MALTCKTLAQACLDYIDVQFLAQASESQKMAVATAINGALQEIWAAGPPHFKRRELSAVIHGPTTVHFTVAPNTRQIYDFEGWADWMVGCTVRVDGDVFDNEIADGGTLLQPFQGSINGRVTAQVFGDAVTMAPEVSSILGCVRLADIRELVPSPNREAFNRANYWHEGDYGEALLSVQVRRKWTGQPHTYWVDTVYLPEATLATEPSAGENIYHLPPRPAQPAIRLRVAPIPAAQFILKWDAEINPPNVTVEGLGDDTRVFQLPGHNDEGVLLPFVLQRFSACPWFKNTDARAEIARQFTQARAAVYGSRPQVKRARGFNPIR